MIYKIHAFKIPVLRLAISFVFSTSSATDPSGSTHLSVPVRNLSSAPASGQLPNAQRAVTAAACYPLAVRHRSDTEYRGSVPLWMEIKGGESGENSVEGVCA